MPRERPGAVTAAAVMSIIYGSLMTLCGLCGAAMLIMQGALGNNFMGGNDPVQAAFQKDLEAALADRAPGYQFMQIFTTVAGLLVSIALLVGGIAMLSMVRWSRKFTLISCAVGIFDVILTAFYQIAFVIPAMKSVFQAGVPAAIKQQGMPAPNVQPIMAAMETMVILIAVATVVIYVLVAIYFVIIIMLLSRRHVRDAFAGVPALAGFDDDQFYRERSERRRREDEEDDDWKQPPPPDDPMDDRFRAK